MAGAVPDGFIALQRFGLGARPGDLDAVKSDPRGAVLAEIDPAIVMLDDPSLPDTERALQTIRTIQMDRKANKAAAEPAPEAPSSEDSPMADSGDAGPAMSDVDPGNKGKGKKKKQRQANSEDPMKPGNPIAQELAARLVHAADMQIGFAERWAMFWTNHFAIEADSNQLVRWAAGAYDREAIRPHVFGRFENILFAATQHPAMLRYLNNATSIGPDSKQGKKNGRGLNENHARELMELHTIGVDAGYTQADVTSFAKVLTGWTFGQNPDQPKRFAKFFFNPNTHEPGSETILGRHYDQRDVEQGNAVLMMLASHPATATHISTKLVHAFVADTPPPELVAALAKTFTETDGDLGEVAKALVKADASWTAPMQKVRLPQEYLLAASRALSVTPKPPQLVKALATLGQPLFNPPSPEGFHDDAATWLAPDAMTNRLDIAQNFAQQADSSADARDVAEAVLSDAQSPQTREAIARAEGPVQGLTILLMSPEFQRR
ncbi:MAG: DUF1800 domain-containing protein [Devosia sp.]